VSQFVLACYRRAAEGGANGLAERVARIEERLRPQGLGRRLEIFACSDDLVAASLFQSTGLVCSGGSAAFGLIAKEAGDWACPGAAVPEGSFALVRTSSSAVELVSDAMATRCIWYCFDDDKLVASSSQRALLMLLGTFEPSERPLPWILANGVLGPEGGWDRRMKRLPPQSSLRLDRSSWKLDLQEPALDFAPGSRDERDWAGAYRQATDSAVNLVASAPGDWVLPLSGGFDSRILACLLKGRRAFRTVTWGMGEGPFSTRPEAEAAAQLAKWAGFSHEYAEIDTTSVPFSEAAQRFVAVNESQTDHFVAYRDGFAVWQGLGKSADGVILGDEAFGGFGWSPVHDEAQARASVGLCVPGEIPGLGSIPGLEFSGTRLPQALMRMPDEDLLTWRYRLFHDFRIPVARAAQAETKARFVEVCNPHQFASVLQIVRRLPHELRTDKRLLIEYARELTPSVPFCSAREGDQLLDELKSEAATEFLNDELNSTAAINLWGSRTTKAVLDRMSNYQQRSPQPTSPITFIKRAARNYLPRPIKRRLKKYLRPPELHPAQLAFRMWQAGEVRRVMGEDVRRVKGKGLRG